MANVVYKPATEIRFQEATASGTNYAALKGAAALAANVTFTLPDADGAAGQPLTTDGAGGLSFGTTGGSGANQLVSTWVLTLPFLQATTTTVNHKWMDIANSATGRVYLGVESATGNNLIAGGIGDANAAVLTTPVGGGKLLIGTNNTRRIEIAATGEVTIFGSLIISTQTPASATAAGVAGTITWDANYVYVCTATNTWKRTAISTW